MDDKTVVAMVKSNAVNLELDTLREIVDYLRDAIALRTVGKPEGLKVGSTIHAFEVKYEINHYGEVSRLTGSACFIKSPGSEFETRIPYSKNVIRIVDDNEWRWIDEELRKRSAKISEELAEEQDARITDLEEAIASRALEGKKRRTVSLKDGTSVSLYRGEYVHAYRADEDRHLYGVVVDFTPKSCYIAHRYFTARGAHHLFKDGPRRGIDGSRMGTDRAETGSPSKRLRLRRPDLVATSFAIAIAPR